MTSAKSTALIPYTSTKTALEFIRFEVERGVKNGTISFEQLGRRAPILFSIYERVDLSAMGKHIEEHTKIGASSLRSRNIDRLINARIFKSNHLTFSRLLSSNVSDDHQKPKDNVGLGDASNPIDPVTSANVNGTMIAEVLLSEAGFTNAADQKPLLATYGCGPCVALGGYDAINKIAFIVHFTNADEVKRSGDVITSNISKLAKEKIDRPIQLHLRGGIEGESEAIIDAIKSWVVQRNELPMEIASEDILDSGESWGKTLLIDSRTGAVSEYDPMVNPEHRVMNELENMSAMLRAILEPVIVVYNPNQS